MIQKYEGTCDVCGELISMEHDRNVDGIIDYAVTDEGQEYTWIRHIAGKNPDCSVYSSRVYEVPWPK